MENDNLERKRRKILEEIEKDRTLIKRFMEIYGEEWQKLGDD